jgi:two-component system NtrC family sensor kinase
MQGSKSHKKTEVEPTQCGQSRDADLQREEWRYGLFDNIQQGCAYCCMVYEDGRPVDFIHERVNSQFLKLFGLKELAGRKATEVIPGIRESNPEFFDTFARVALNGVSERFEICIKALDLWLDIMAYCPEKGSFIALFDDITTRKQSAESIRVSNERLQLIMSAAHAGIWDWDLSTNRNIWTDELWRLYGLEQHSCEASYEVWLQAINPKDRKKTKQAALDAVTKGVEFNSIWRTRDIDGRERWLLSKGTPFRGTDGQVCRYVGIVLDITARKMAENAFLESERRFQELTDLLPQPVFELDLQGKVTYTNRAGMELFGYSIEEIQSDFQSVRLVVQEERAKVKHNITCLLENRPIENHEYTALKKDGSTFPILLYTSRIVRNNKPVGIRGIVLDITRRKHTEEKLRILNQTLEERIQERTKELELSHQQMMLQEKLASIGLLAAGIAHELNNPINFLKINFATQQDNISSLLLVMDEYRRVIEKLEQGTFSAIDRQNLLNLETELTLDTVLNEIPEIFAESDRGFARITTIINSMRNFSHRHGTEEKVFFNLNKGIEDTLIVARNEYRDYAHIETTFEELPALLCIPEQINQVLLNLIVNSAHAIALQKRNSFGKICIHTSFDSSNIYCRIADDGPGIPEEVRNRVFEPFFTTKSPGKGTGLGLSLSYDIIVHKHNGTLSVECPVEGGTVFTLSLPL